MSARAYSATIDRSRVFGRWLLTVGLAALGLAGLAGAGEAGAWQPATDIGAEHNAPEARARRDRLQAQSREAQAAHQAERERYQRGVREAEAARVRYEADLARHRQESALHQREVARSAEARAHYETRLAARETVPAAVRREPAYGSPPSAAARNCEERLERNRRRGRLVGALAGGLAGLAGGRRGDRATLVAALVPAGALLGDAIAGLLDCDEQQQAASATEQAVSRGVGTTTSWASATRPGVTGSSTVTAAEQRADGGDCLTVTDVVIVEGEETRAPKRLCRRPPANRYVRV